MRTGKENETGDNRRASHLRTKIISRTMCKSDVCESGLRASVMQLAATRARISPPRRDIPRRQNESSKSLQRKDQRGGENRDGKRKSFGLGDETNRLVPSSKSVAQSDRSCSRTTENINSFNGLVSRFAHTCCLPLALGLPLPYSSRRPPTEFVGTSSYNPFHK